MAQPKSVIPQLMIVTGLSGSGMSSAMNVFEDLGYFCVDNLPVQLIPSFVHLFEMADSGITRAALSVNIREGEFQRDFPALISKLRTREDLETTVLFLEAGDAVLLRRYSETRRPHPMGHQLGSGGGESDTPVLEAIREERTRLESIRKLADVTVDTTDHTVHTLRSWLKARFSPENLADQTEITILSFGFKYGIPLDADLLFDVRFLPNPHFIPELRSLTGNDPPVLEFLERSEEASETTRRFNEMLDYLMPLYQREGKSYVTVAIGCTGGRHRSVALANAIGRHLTQGGYRARTVHRDVKK